MAGASHDAKDERSGADLPLILVHGMFGWGKNTPAWGMLQDYWPRQIIDFLWKPGHFCADVGMVASDFDRAVELFYQVKGGRVDYGQEHAEKHGHKRYGATYEGFYPQWGSENPLHFIGHSYGGTTSLTLYQLLCQDFFGVGSDHSWIRSISTLGSPLNGATLPYILGLQHPTLDVKKNSFAHALGAGLGLIWWAGQKSKVMRGLYDFRIQQWSDYTTLKSILTLDHPWFTSRDNCLHGCVPHHQMQRNKQYQQLDKLYLFSFVASNTYSPSYLRLPFWLQLWRLIKPTAVVMFLFYFLRRKDVRDFRLPLGIPKKVVATVWFLVWRWRLYRAGTAALRSLPAPRPWRCPAHHPVATVISHNPISWLFHYLIDTKRFPEPVYPGFDSELWAENDGICNTVSQQVPWTGPAPRLEKQFPSAVDLKSLEEGGPTREKFLLRARQVQAQPPTACPVKPLTEVLHGPKGQPLMCTCGPAFGAENRARQNSTGWPELHVERGQIQKGVMHTHKVAANHFFGTNLDDQNRTIQLLRTLFASLRSL